MSFAIDMDRIINHVEGAVYDLIRNSAAHAERSIVEGSDITGAPGQPVLTGRLKYSFQRNWRSRASFVIFSNEPHARIIEDNLRGAQLRSRVGGFHSIKLTYNGWRRIVGYELRRIPGSS